MVDWNAVTAIVTAISAAWAAWTYWKSTQVRRSEWLDSLYVRFYKQPQYKPMRRIIDNETAELTALRVAIEENRDNELVEHFIDYLNFFEFIAFLMSKQQLTKDEVDATFAYYLENLSKHEFIVTYIKQYGFENLAKELADRLKRKGKKR